MDIKELQQKNDAELKEFIAEKREAIRKLRFGGAGSGMRNTKAIKNLRKEVAQALTEVGTRTRKVSKEA